MIYAKHTPGDNLLKQQKYWIPENRRNEIYKLKNRTVVTHPLQERDPGKRMLQKTELLLA